jgi:hypothetical protein
MGGPNDPPSAPNPPDGFFSLIQEAEIQAAIQPIVQKVGDAAARIRRIDDHLGSLGSGTDPAYTTSDDHFEGMTYQQLYEAVHGDNGVGGLDPRGLQTMRQVWAECCSDLENLSVFNQLGMNNIFGHGLWQGAAADAAQAASERYSQAANQIGQVFDSVAQRMDSLAWAAEAVRKAVQPPPASVVLNPDPDDRTQSLLPLLPDPRVTDQASVQQEQARQDAIRALQATYTPSFPPAGANVPAYLNVPQVTGGDGTPSSTTSGNNTGSGPSSTQGTPPTDPADPAAPTPQDPGQTTPQDPGQQPGNSPQDSSPAATDPGRDLSRGPATTGDRSDPSATTTAGVEPGASNPTIPGSPASNPGTTRYDTPGLPGMQPGGPGLSRPGLPGVGIPETPAAAASTAAAQSGSPMGSMPHGAQRRKEDEDRDHYSADYLKRVQPEWTAGIQAPVGVVGADYAPEADAPSDIPVTPESASPRRPAQFAPADRAGHVTAYTDDHYAAPADPVPGAARTARNMATISTNAVVAQRNSEDSGSGIESRADADHGSASAHSVPRAPGADLSATGEMTQAASEKAGGYEEEPPPFDDFVELSEDGKYLTISGAGPVMDDESGKESRR